MVGPTLVDPERSVVYGQRLFSSAFLDNGFRAQEKEGAGKPLGGVEAQR